MRVVLGFLGGLAVGVLTSGQMGYGFFLFLNMVEFGPEDDFGVRRWMSVLMFAWPLLLGVAGVLVARRLGGRRSPSGSPE